MWRIWGRSVWHEINKFQLLGSGRRLAVVRAYENEACIKEHCPIKSGEYFLLLVDKNGSKIYCPKHSPYQVEIND